MDTVGLALLHQGVSSHSADYIYIYAHIPAVYGLINMFASGISYLYITHWTKITAFGNAFCLAYIHNLVIKRRWKYIRITLLNYFIELRKPSAQSQWYILAKLVKNDQNSVQTRSTSQLYSKFHINPTNGFLTRNAWITRNTRRAQTFAAPSLRSVKQSMHAWNSLANCSLCPYPQN